MLQPEAQVLRRIRRRILFVTLKDRKTMFTRNLKDVEGTGHHVDWGNGTSHRLLTRADQMGFTVCHTVVRAGSDTPELLLDDGFPGHWTADSEQLVVAEVQFSHDGRALGGQTYLYDLADGSRRTLPVDGAEVTRFPRAGRTAATMVDGHLALLDLDSLQTHPTEIMAMPLGFTPTGDAVLAYTPELKVGRLMLVAWPDPSAAPVVDVELPIGGMDENATLVQGMDRLVLEGTHLEEYPALLTLDASGAIIDQRVVAVPPDTVTTGLLYDGDILAVSYDHATREVGIRRGGPNEIGLHTGPPDHVVVIDQGMSDAGDAADSDVTYLFLPATVGGRVVRSTDDFEMTDIATIPFDVHAVMVSPDGTELALTDDRLRVVVVPIDAPDLRSAVVQARGQAVADAEVVSWTRDGAGLVLRDSNDGQLFLHDRASGARTELHTEAEAAVWFGDHELLVSLGKQVLRVDLHDPSASPEVFFSSDLSVEIVGVSGDRRKALVQLERQHDRAFEITVVPTGP